MDAEAKLECLLESIEAAGDPLVESMLDAISCLDANWDLSQAPMMEATRAILAAVVIDYGVLPDDDDQPEFNDFERRFDDAFKTFRMRVQSADRHV